MKYQKLKELKDKADKLKRLENIFIVLVIAFLILLPVPCFGPTYLIAPFIAGNLIVTCLLCVLTIVLRFNLCKCYELKEDYIVVKVMDIISNNISNPNGFEWVKDEYGDYVVGFRNQTVDYDKLESIIKPELDEMNKIADMSIKVKLI